MTTGQQEQWEWGNRIKGGVVRQRVREALLAQYQDELSAKGLKVEILRFDQPNYEQPFTETQERELAKYRAATDSTNVKIAAFQRLGVEVPQREPLPQDMEIGAFQNLINQLNTDVSVNAIIVQYPVPARLSSVIAVIDPQKDLDALSQAPIFPVPATSEGILRVVEPFAGVLGGSSALQSEAIARLIEPFASGDATVAVVGARGFVGQGVIRLLEAQNLSYITIDLRDEGFRDEDLLRVRDADIVVSATGQAGILDERHLTPYHRVVVDCGYVPIGNDQLGDVARSSYGIPQNITPVPGGSGPIEMAILMERIVRKEIDPNLESWRLQDYQTINYYTRPELEALQQQWASSIYPTARTMMVLMQDRLQTTSPGVLALEGQNHYRITADSNTDSLTIASRTNSRALVSFTLKGEIKSAAGLTATDHKNWQVMQRTLETLRRQRGNNDRDAGR